MGLSVKEKAGFARESVGKLNGLFNCGVSLYVMSTKKVCDPTWWRLGWIPYAVLPMVAAAADLCFPVISSEGLRYLGIGSGIGVILLISAILLLRNDYTRREQVFLGMLAFISMLALLVSGSHVGWILSLTVPFFVIMFGPGKAAPVDKEVEYRNWWSFWRDRRGHIKGSFWRRILPTLISVTVGIICFIAFLCIFASGNPVVQLVWDFIVTWWNRIMEFLQISWDFWAHVLVWGAGILAFALYTVRRPTADVTALPEVPNPEPEAGHSMLPHLPLMVLLGVNLAFLVATSTDIAFLWFHRVPEGVSQTDYLYEGAVSITWASVLAAGLLIYFFRRRGSVRRTVVARSLGYVLVVQTLLLAISVYVRLYNQISTYGFTPNRVTAGEFMLIGVAGLVILLCYMSRSGSFLRYIRICGCTLGLLWLCFTINPPSALSGDLNLRYASAHPAWNFSLVDFQHGRFSVQENLAFAFHVYELQKKAEADLSNVEFAEEYNRRMHSFESRLKVAALALERRRASWRSFTLRDYWDRRAAECILGRPLEAKPVEPVH